MPSAAGTGPLVPVLLAWLVPGAGHLALRRFWPALFVALGVVPLFLLGMYLTGWENVSWTRHPFYFVLQAPAGLPAAIGALLTRETLPDRVMPHGTVGTLYSAVAGLLNLMAIADVWARAQRGDPEDAAQRATAGAAAGAAVGAAASATGDDGAQAAQVPVA